MYEIKKLKRKKKRENYNQTYENGRIFIQFFFPFVAEEISIF